MKVDMKNKFVVVFLMAGVLYLLSSITMFSQDKKGTSAFTKGESMNEKSDKDWKQVLTPAQYSVLREKGTERPFTGKYWNNFAEGVYKCAACGEILFDSVTKFDAGCGWPSFSDVISNEKIITQDDYSYGMKRVEVMCAKCGGHLGHVFDDGPKPTGQRYCINSLSLKFEKKNK
jgi:peptide-methionine (R)-S-oxide reductase